MTARLASHLGSLLFLAVPLIPSSSLGQTVNVTTWHNDNWRTGQNTSETTLTTTLVGDPTKFGRIWGGWPILSFRSETQNPRALAVRGRPLKSPALSQRTRAGRGTRL